MKRSVIIILIFVSLVIISLLIFSGVKRNKPLSPPNIIFILTDDLGYGDIGVLFQNQREKEGKPFHRTPNLDNMAAEGMLLTRHYVPAPVCAPSRASLLRGVHQGNAEVRNNQFDKALPDNHTLASVLKEAGYSTAIIGKYGLQGKEGNSPETWDAYPTKRGFDYFFGYAAHRDGHNHYPAHEARQRPPVDLYSDNQEISSKLKGCYTADLFTAMAKKWITGQTEENPDKPFFLYLAYDTPHAGLQVASMPYPNGGGLDGGVQYTGEKGRFINTVTDTIDNYFHPDYADKPWPEFQIRFASMVRRIDNAVGDVFQLLKDLGIDENTIVFFSSDNGPHAESYGYGDYTPTLFNSYGNMDGIKRDTWEGGIRVPLIARWPSHIKPGSRDATPTQFHDWLATFSDVAGIPAPAVTDGVSLMPVLSGEGMKLPGMVYIEYSVGGKTPDYASFDSTHRDLKRGEMQVVYLDGFKGVRYNIQSYTDDFRIYDTQVDPEELNNLDGSSDYFNNLQETMKEKALQMRHSNSEAVRPYDSIPVPPVNISNEPVGGLSYQRFDLTVPWTPDIASLDADPSDSGFCDDLSMVSKLDKKNCVLAFKGYLNVPATGEYKFNFRSDGKAVIRLHEACLIDADKPYSSGDIISGNIILAEGLHPFSLVYKRGTDPEPYLLLGWEGPGITEEQINSANFFHIPGDN